jgi:hypothetical protein
MRIWFWVVLILYVNSPLELGIRWNADLDSTIVTFSPG